MMPTAVRAISVAVMVGSDKREGRRGCFVSEI